MGVVHAQNGTTIRVTANGRTHDFAVRVMIDNDSPVQFVSAIMCDVCNENDAGDYKPNGHAICSSCVSTALTYRRIMDVLSFDVFEGVFMQWAHVLSWMDVDDDDMRNSAMSYVDSHTAAADMFIGCEIVDVMCWVNAVAHDIGCVIHDIANGNDMYAGA